MKCFQVIEMSIATMMELNEISRLNNKENGGNLSLTFYQMLCVLHKHNIVPELMILVHNDKKIGYCLYYQSDHDIQISHICLRREYQGKHLASHFMNYLLEFHSIGLRLTAHVSYENECSKKFFQKFGFDFIEEPLKNRWKVRKEVNNYG